MSAYSRVVQQDPPHKIYRGDPIMGQQYDATYKFNNATVHVVAPSPMSEEELQRRIADMHRTGWAIWNSFSVEQRLRINADAENKRKDNC